LILKAAISGRGNMPISDRPLPNQKRERYYAAKNNSVCKRDGQ